MNETRIGAGTVALSLLIAAIWGFNFVVIKVGVSSVPPLALACLRFLFSAVPAVFFVKRPKAPLGKIAAYGLFLGVGEFGFLFTAIKLGAPAGLSSILLQAQAFLTAILAAIFLGERLRAHNFVGMAVAALGLAIFAFGAGTGSGGLSPLLVAMIVVAALGWAAANVVVRTMPGTDALGLMVWSSLFSPLPLAALSLAFEGPSRIGAAFAELSLLTLGALVYLVLLSTLAGYGLWNTLIMRHGAGKIAPFSLLVPIFGLLAASLVLHEALHVLDAAAAALILAGLLVHVLGGRLGRLGGSKERGARSA
ncbi:MAG: EamA family transporter [Treponema sp.]|nr:EamA family transporter [Treponema sp.]